MTIVHHPDDATLMSFAAGSLTEALAAVVATHIAMCPRCARELELLELVGTALIESMPQQNAWRTPPPLSATQLEIRLPGRPHARQARFPHR